MEASDLCIYIVTLSQAKDLSDLAFPYQPLVSCGPLCMDFLSQGATFGKSSFKLSLRSLSS